MASRKRALRVAREASRMVRAMTEAENFAYFLPNIRVQTAADVTDHARRKSLKNIDFALFADVRRRPYLILSRRKQGFESPRERQ
jgi:hypothetical protein